MSGEPERTAYVSFTVDGAVVSEGEISLADVRDFAADIASVARKYGLAVEEAESEGGIDLDIGRMRDDDAVGGDPIAPEEESSGRG